MARVLPKFPRRRVSPKRRLKRRCEPALGLRLLTLQPALEPHDLLELEYCLRRVEPSEVDQLELSVMWRTEGKGTEDIGVHFFESLSGAELSDLINARPKHACTTMPASPLSFEGSLLKIRWCVRLRLHLADGREITTEQPFYLGHLTSEI